MNYIIVTVIFLIIARWLFKIAPAPGSIVPDKLDMKKYKDMNNIPLKPPKTMEEYKLEQDKFMYRPRTPKPPGDSHLDYTYWPGTD